MSLLRLTGWTLGVLTAAGVAGLAYLFLTFPSVDTTDLTYLESTDTPDIAPIHVSYMGNTNLLVSDG